MQAYTIHIDQDQRELTTHGSYAFPLAIYTTQLSKNVLGFVDWHWHDELQFCYINTGEVQFQVNNATIVLSEGDGLFINKGHLHTASNVEHQDSTYTCIDFHEHLISSFVGSRINTNYIQKHISGDAVPFCILRHSDPLQSDIVQRLADIYTLNHHKEEGYDFDIYIILLGIWHDLIKTCFNTTTQSYDKTVHSESIKAIIRYVHEHYRDRIVLEALAKEVNLSKSSLCRKFKHTMHFTLFEYIQNYRLSMAAERLQSSNDAITAIAYQCGFSSCSYFIDKFKQKTGLSPLKYRNQHKP